MRYLKIDRRTSAYLALLALVLYPIGEVIAFYASSPAAWLLPSAIVYVGLMSAVWATVGEGLEFGSERERAVAVAVVGTVLYIAMGFVWIVLKFGPSQIGVVPLVNWPFFFLWHLGCYGLFPWCPG